MYITQCSISETTTKVVVVDNGTDKKGKNNQSDQGYDTKDENDNPGHSKEPGKSSGSTDDGSGAKIVTASQVITLISMFLTILV